MHPTACGDERTPRTDSNGGRPDNMAGHLSLAPAGPG